MVERENNSYRGQDKTRCDISTRLSHLGYTRCHTSASNSFVFYSYNLLVPRLISRFRRHWPVCGGYNLLPDP